MIGIDGFRFHMTDQRELPKELNSWSRWLPVKVEVVDFYMNPRWMTWRGKKFWVADYEFFVMLIRQWMEGSMFSPGMTKEAAIDLFVEMGQYDEA